MLVAGPLDHAIPDRLRHRLQLDAKLARRLLQQALAQLDGLVELGGLEVMPDRRARLARADEGEPRRIRLRVRRRHHLDDIAALQLGAQRQQLVVDLDRHALVAQVAVHRVGEVQRRGAARQCADMALRREHVDRVREQVDLDVLQELLRVAGLALDVQQ
ncbi:hypothetical protein D3C81_1084300 [compost metagenome]